MQMCHRVRVWSQRLFAARADGKPSTLLDEASRRAYFMCTHVRPAALGAIIAAAGRADDAPDAAAALQALTAVLVRHFDPLQRTFAHYAASEPGEASTMGAARRKSPHSHAARDPLGSRSGSHRQRAVAALNRRRTHAHADFDEFHKTLSESGLFAKPAAGAALVTAAQVARDATAACDGRRTRLR